MIISHRHRFIYFSVPRTATHAIRLALTPHIDLMDWQQQNLFAKSRLPIEPLAEKEHGHLSVVELRPYLPDDIWSSYFKFAFVRNPFERFVSTCFFLHGRDPAFAASPVEYMKHALATPAFRRRNLLRPQTRYLEQPAGGIGVDHLGRTESLQGSYDEICRLIGIPTSKLKRKNIDEHGPYTEYYDRELREAVGLFYREDLDNFGYGFGED